MNAQGCREQIGDRGDPPARTAHLGRAQRGHLQLLDLLSQVPFGLLFLLRFAQLRLRLPPPRLLRLPCGFLGSTLGGLLGGLLWGLLRSGFGVFGVLDGLFVRLVFSGGRVSLEQLSRQSIVGRDSLDDGLQGTPMGRQAHAADMRLADGHTNRTRDGIEIEAAKSTASTPNDVQRHGDAVLWHGRVDWSKS